MLSISYSLGEQFSDNEVDDQSVAQVNAHPDHRSAPFDTAYPFDADAPYTEEGSDVYPSRANIYGGYYAGMAGAFAPELFPQPDPPHGEDRHSKKKKSKKSKKKSKNKSDDYYYYGDDGMALMPQKALVVGDAASGFGEEPFETYLPGAVDHYVVDEKYDPAWHYDMKSYIREQQHVNGYTDPVSHRPYESHIDEFPPVDYMDDDDGPYERRLPERDRRAAELGRRKMNSNFIIRQRDDFHRRP